jgi:hypothetical protein
MQDYIDSAGGAVADDDCSWVESDLGTNTTTSSFVSKLTWSYPDVPANLNLQQCRQTVTFAFGVQDQCGLSAQTTGKIVFVDSTSPVISKQPLAVTTVSREEHTPNMLREWLKSAGGAVASDACDHGARWSYDGAPTLPKLDVVGCRSEVDVVFMVTDNCGNVAYTEPARFVVEDATPPKLTGVSDRTVECKANGNSGHLRNWLTKYGGNGKCVDTNGDTDPSITYGNEAWVQSLNVFGGCNDRQVTTNFTCIDDCGLGMSSIGTFYAVDTTPPKLSSSKKSDLVHYCDARCVSSQDAEQANAKTLFNRWKDEKHGCLEGSDQCNVVGWTTVIVPDEGATFNSNQLCGTSGSATFTATDACGNAASETLKYSFPEIPAPQVYLPEALPDIHPVNKHFTASNTCYICQQSDGTRISRRFARLLYRWEGTSGVTATLASAPSQTANKATLVWGDQFILYGSSSFKVPFKVTITSEWAGEVQRAAMSINRKCIDAPGQVIGERTEFGSIGALILVGFESVGGATEADCQGGMPVPYFKFPSLGTVLERGCCYKFTSKSGVLVRSGYTYTASGGMCNEIDEPAFPGTKGQRFEPGIACPQLEANHNAGVDTPYANPAPSVAEPTTCGRYVGLIDVCTRGVPPSDAITVTAKPSFDGSTSGCCYDQRESFATGLVISEGHFGTTMGACDTTIQGRRFTPKVTCSALKVTQTPIGTTAGCCFVRMVSGGKYEYKGHIESLAKDCAVSRVGAMTMIGFQDSDCMVAQAVQAIPDIVEGCERNMCDAKEANRDGLARLTLRYTASADPEAFSHGQTWRQRKEGVYDDARAGYPAYIRVASKGGDEVFQSDYMADGELIELDAQTIGKSKFPGNSIRIQIGKGKQKALMSMGIDCKAGRVLQIGDQWGLLTVVGYTLKQGAACVSTVSGEQLRVAITSRLSGDEDSSALDGDGAMADAKSVGGVVGGVIGALIALMMVIMVGVAIVRRREGSSEKVIFEDFNLDHVDSANETSSDGFTEFADQPGGLHETLPYGATTQWNLMPKGEGTTAAVRDNVGADNKRTPGTRISNLGALAEDAFEEESDEVTLDMFAPI